MAAAVTPDYTALKEVALFLPQPNLLPPDSALGLFISVANAWQVLDPLMPDFLITAFRFRPIQEVALQWRGYVSNAHPSEVMPLLWPEVTGNPAALAPGTIQLGVSVEPLGMAHSPSTSSWRCT